MSVGNLVVVSYLLPLILFIYRYARYSPWTMSFVGRALMGEKIAFSLVIALVLLGSYAHDYPGRDWIRLVVYASVLVFLWWDFMNLLHIQNKARGVQKKVRWKDRVR